MAEPKKKRQSKIRTLMEQQTVEQNTVSSVEIESILTNEMESTINYFIGKYGSALDRALGMEKDDIVNDMREQIWKGLLTHKVSGTANRKTYMNKLVTNRFNTLLERSRKKKYTSLEYHSDVWETGGGDPEYTETEETPESLLLLREAVMQDCFHMSDTEQEIYMYLKMGASLREMEKQQSMTRQELIAIIGRIDSLLTRGANG